MRARCGRAIDCLFQGMMIAGHLEGNGMPRMIVIAAGFVLATILPASARDDTQLYQKSCQRISDQQVSGLFERWNKSLATKNPDTVVANYAKDATLLPTVKNGPLIGSERHRQVERRPALRIRGRPGIRAG